MNLIVPNPDPLTILSPSTAENLRECWLRIAFQRDPKYRRRLPLKVAAILGEAAHEMSRRVWKGFFDGFADEEVEHRVKFAWDEVLESVLEMRAGAESRQDLVPGRWPNYQRVRTKAIRSANKAVANRRQHRVGQSTSVTKTYVEGDLVSEVSPLFGRPDRVIVRGSNVEIVDLKTSRDAEDGMPEKARRQLLLYAALWEEVHGVVPTTLTLEAVGGSRTSVSVTRDRVNAQKESAFKSFTDFNEAVKDPAGIVDLASPSSDTCRFCDYKALCGPFFEGLSEEWNWYHAEFLGIARGIYGKGEIRTVSLECELPRVHSGELISVIDIPADLIPIVGSRVAFSGLGHLRGDRNYRFRYDSDIAVWASSGISS